jgi:hypothetical protein
MSNDNIPLFVSMMHPISQMLWLKERQAKMSIGTLAFNECCQRIINAANKKEGGRNMPYAASYAYAGKRMTDREEIRVQALYILGNIAQWRGDEAKMVRDTLKQFANVK